MIVRRGFAWNGRNARKNGNESARRGKRDARNERRGRGRRDETATGDDAAEVGAETGGAGTGEGRSVGILKS